MHGNEFSLANGFSGIALSDGDGKIALENGVSCQLYAKCLSTKSGDCVNQKPPLFPDKQSFDCENDSTETLGVHWRILAAFLYGIYTWFPLNTTSRLVGTLAQIRVPRLLRKPAWRVFAWIFKVSLEEAEFHDDLSKYPSMSAFFRRRLLPSARAVDPHACLTCPVDGRIVSCGKVEKGHLAQVKGLAYTLRALLGPNTWLKTGPLFAKGHRKLCRPITVPSRLADGDFEEDLPSKGEENDDLSIPFYSYLHSSASADHTGKALYHCAIYLAPGDYHCFHAPTDWTINIRRHFPGRLFSVCSLVTSWLSGLFCINERAVYMGKWAHGFLAYVAVGATNVGSIHVFRDPGLVTNRQPYLPRNPFATRHDVPLDTDGLSVDSSDEVPVIIKMDTFEEIHFPNPLRCTKGELFGEFNFGSTVVLIFEAPASDFEFVVSPGEHVQMGRPLGQLRQEPVAST